MKKITKLSLVAAVAALGFTSVNAQSLEEAIKNVDISGTAAYRYNNYKTGLKDGQNNYKIGLNLSSKLDDNFKVNTRTIVGGATFNTADKLTLNAGTQGDTQAIVSLSEINFEFTGIEGTSIKVGKQAIVSPYAVAADALGNEQTGTGISASVSAGPLLASAAYFNQINDNDILGNAHVIYLNQDLKTSAENSGKVYATNKGQNGVTGSLGLDFGVFASDISYLGIMDSAKDNNFHVVGIGANASQEFDNGKIGFDVRYSSATWKRNVILDASDTSYYRTDYHSRQSLFKIGLNASYSIVNAKIAYLIGGKDGAKVSLDEDSSSTINGWASEIYQLRDARYILGNINFDVLDNFNIAFNYNFIKGNNMTNLLSEDTFVNVTRNNTTGKITLNSFPTNNFELREYYTQLNYKLAKNLSTFLRYGNVEVKDQPRDTRGRLQVVYSF